MPSQPDATHSQPDDTGGCWSFFKGLYYFLGAIALIGGLGYAAYACVFEGPGQVDDITGNASVLSESCNWRGNRNAVEWREPPTATNGVLYFWGSIDNPEVRTDGWMTQNTGQPYYSPFYVYGDCQSRPIATILPPLPGNRYWSTLDPTDAVATVWETSGQSFRIEVRLPPSVAEHDRIELHVSDPEQSSTATLWGVKRIKF